MNFNNTVIIQMIYGQFPSIKDKLKFIPKPIDQLCKVHLAPAIYFCSKIDCKMNTFLCERCRRDNIHNHSQQIQDYPSWIETMTGRISKIKAKPINSRIFQSMYSQSTNRKDFNRYLAQLKRVFQTIETLQINMLEIMKQSKAKISSYIKKYENYTESKLSAKGYLYANPFLLVNKINSQRNDEFVQELKRCIRGQSSDLIDNFNPKYELINLQNRLKKMIEGSNNEVFNINKQISRPPFIQPYQDKVITLGGKPDKVFMGGNYLLVNLKNYLQIHSLSDMNIKDILETNILKASIVVIDKNLNFIGINKQNTINMITYINQKIGGFTFSFTIYSHLLYYYKNKFYALIGRDEGKIAIFDFSTGVITATLQQPHNSKIEYIRSWEGHSKIFTYSRNNAINVYSIMGKSEDLELKNQEEISLKLENVGLFEVGGSYLFSFLPGRNVVVFDLVLRVQFKSNFNEQCKNCDFFSLLAETEQFLMFATHNEGENHLCIWTIEKSKPDNIKCEKYLFFDREECEILEMSGKNVWVYRTMDPQKRLYKFILSTN